MYASSPCESSNAAVVDLRTACRISGNSVYSSTATESIEPPG